MTIEKADSYYAVLRDAGERQGWWNAPGLLVAVSGGGDSMALLAMLRAYYRGRLVAAHLEHGIRGASSRADAEFVSEYCRCVSVPCFVRHADVPALRRGGESLEMTGRRVRYEFFSEVMESEDLPFIATGHNADDVTETVLYNLFRGSGLRGLRGMAPARGRVVRPLIGFRRGDLRRYLADRGIKWREDETNEEDHYARNKIRNRLLPWARANLNESCDRALLGLASLASEAEREREKDAASALIWVRRSHPYALAAWHTETARLLDDARLAELIRLQGRELGLPALSSERTRGLTALLRRDGKWRFQWAGDVEVCGGAALVGWIRRGDLSPPAAVRFEAGAEPLREPGLLRWGRWAIELRVPEGAKHAPRGLWQSPVPAGDLRVAPLSGEPAPAGASRLPWWTRPGWPVLGDWIPGVKCVREEAAYVMIARVFCARAE